MKYHTTFSNIVYSLLLLLLGIIVVAAILPATLNVSDTQIREKIASLLNLGDEYHLQVGSIEKSLLTKTTIHDVQLLSYDKKIQLSANKVTLKHPLYRLLFSSLNPKRVKVEIEGLSIDLKEFTFPNQESVDFSLPVGLDVTVDDLSLNYRLHGSLLSLYSTTLKVGTSKEEIEFFSLDAPKIEFSSSQFDLFSSLEVELSKKGRAYTFDLLLSAFTLSQKSVPLTLFLNSLSLSGSSATLSTLLEGSLTTNFLFDSLSGSNEVGEVTVDSGVGSLSLEQFTLHSGSTIVDEVKGEFKEWELHLPQSKIELESDHLTFHPLISASLFWNKEGVAQINDSFIEWEKGETTHLVRIDSSSIESLADVGALFNLPYHLKVKGEEIYLLALFDAQKGKIDIESSLNVEIESSLHPLNRVAFQLLADGVYRLDSSYEGQLEVRSLESKYLPQGGGALISFGSDLPLFGQLKYRQGATFTYEQTEGEQSGKITLNFSSFLLEEAKPLLGELLPSVATIIDTTTSISGNMSVGFNSQGIIGRSSAEFGLTNLLINNNHFNVGATLSARTDNEAYHIDLATLTTEGIRLSYSGSIDRLHRIPRGSLSVREVASGKERVFADFEHKGAQLYNYSITMADFPSSTIEGTISWEEENLLKTEAIFSTKGQPYPFTLTFNSGTSLLDIEVGSSFGHIDVVTNPGHLALSFLFDQFPLLFTEPLYVNGGIEADISLSDGLFLVLGEGLGFEWEHQQRALYVDLEADQRQLRLNNVRYKDGEGELRGELTLYNAPLLSLFNSTFEQFSLTAFVEEETKKTLQLYLYNDEGESSLIRGALKLDQFNVNRFLGTSYPIALTSLIVGEGDLKGYQRLYGDVEASVDSSVLSFEFYLLPDKLEIEKGSYSNNFAHFSLPQATFNFSGFSSIDLHLYNDSPMNWRDASSSVELNISTTIEPSSTLLGWVTSVRRAITSLPPITIKNRNALLFGEIHVADASHLLTLTDKSIQLTPLEGGSIEALYDRESSNLSLIASKNFLIPMEVEGFVNSEEINVEIKSLSFDLRLLNPLFVEPIITLERGVIEGSLKIEGPLLDPEYYGTLYANAVDLTTFWTVGELLSIKNPVITLSENLATIAPTHISVVHSSGRSTSAVGQLEATIEKWGIPHYRLDLSLVKDSITFWLPLYIANVDINARVQGSFSIDGTPDEETLYGSIVVSDANFKIGTDEPPNWYTEKERTSVDMDFTTGRNVSFVYPNEESPILRSTFADNQHIHIGVEAPSMTTTFTGELALRSGEIYYVQKNFYITEGVLKFPSFGVSFLTDVMPTLSLRARLREFDIDGSRVDIYLVLQDSSLDDITPRFESIPSRTTNEILELLGQSIISSASMGQGGLQAVVSVATAATDVFSRLGLLQTTTISLGFSTIIRQSLGLDIFTIRTNLLQNILFETLPGIGGDTSLSPLARYLDNTTMFIGKYLSDSLYLQGMLHFRRDSGRRGSSFLANDLWLDTELSVEWTNPLATFSFFAQPDELSVFDFFDTMGISVTKRFEF